MEQDLSSTRVLTKEQMYNLYMRGRFGNRPATWKGLTEFWMGLDSFVSANPGCTNKFGMRYAQIGSRWIAYGLSPTEVRDQITQWGREGASPDKFYITEHLPSDDLVLNAEVTRSITGLDCRYSTVKEPMRPALAKEDLSVSGLKAYSLLRAHLDHTSFDTLYELLQDFPDHVVELSVWSHCVGVLNHNTVFWEVRYY